MSRCSACGKTVSGEDRFCPACGAPLPPPTTTPTQSRVVSATPSRGPQGFTPGTILASRYRIVAFVGRGGMGEVYRADDLRLGETVALKFLPQDVALDPSRRERFDAEVRLARAIAHPNVCRVYDVGEADGRSFLTMEYIDGEDLVSLLRRIGRLPRQKALELARQLCAGLAAAHDLGVLHRDLKPANIMIDGRGRARITDFGLAVTAQTEDEGLGYQGTPAYSAPEQLEGRPATTRSDVYSLGLVLYELFTGKRALEASSTEEWRQVHASSVPSRPSAHIPDVDPAVDAAILRCIEKDPARRPASAAQLAAMLPGGDPLAAAIAAGETPSPDLVAAAAKEGTISVRRASIWLMLVLVGIAVTVYTSVHYAEFNLIPEVKKPDVLEDHVREILRALGTTQPPVQTTWFTRWDRDAAAGAKSLDAIGALRPSPATFGYRQSPRALIPANRLNVVTWNDPPLYYSGEARVATDLSGRLLELTVLPDELESASAPPQPVSWDAAFRFADLDRGAFQETEPKWAPFVPFDERRAWIGKVGTTDLRIEGAAWRGRIVRFTLIAPSTRSARMEAAPVAMVDRVAMLANVGIVLSSLTVLWILARRNVRAGRADRSGAMKTAVVAALLAGAELLLSQVWTDLSSFWDFVSAGLGYPLFAGASVWIYYTGVEPYLRRDAPHRLIAWTRLMDGRWRDPLVGREVLLGTMVGACMSAIFALGWIVSASLSLPGLQPALPYLSPVSRYWAGIAGIMFAGLIWAWVWAAAGLVLKLVLRKDALMWLGLALLASLFAAVEVLPLVVSIPIAVGIGCLYVVSLRVGQVSAVASTFACFALLDSPHALGLDRWYAWRGTFEVAIVAGLAIAGLRVAIGKQPLLPATAME